VKLTPITISGISYYGQYENIFQVFHTGRMGLIFVSIHLIESDTEFV